MSVYPLIIAAFDQNMYAGDVYSLTCQGAAGELTVLAHHEPLITTLKPGTITVRAEDQQQHTFEIEAGILEVSNNRATILV